MTAPILVNFLFFLIYAFASFGLQNFSVVALGQLYGTSPVTANTALSAYLLLSALGVLVGGWMAGTHDPPPVHRGARPRRHRRRRAADRQHRPRCGCSSCW